MRSHPLPITLLLVIAAALLILGFGCESAQAQFRETTLMSANSIIPATPEYGPDGTSTVDSAWVLRSSNDPNCTIGLYACVDSVAGYDSVGLDIAVFYETLSLYDNCIEATGSSHWALLVDTAAVVAPGDTCYFELINPPPHKRRRYMVKVADTCSVTLTEIEQTAAPWKRP